MNILLSNDDGIDAIGMAALIRALKKRHTLYVVAPTVQRSSISRAVSIGVPLHAEPRTLEEFPDVWAYAVDGTPVDCVRVALGNLVPAKIDLCMTGINYGYNIGTDTLYSGTAGAAIEAAVNGIGAVALSNGLENGGKYMDTAGEVALLLADFYGRHPLPRGAFYNVNVPDLPIDALGGIRPASLSPVPYDLGYEERTDEEGRPCLVTPWRKERETDPSTDRSVVYGGAVSVTVLRYDNSHNEALASADAAEWDALGQSLCGRR